MPVSLPELVQTVVELVHRRSIHDPRHLEVPLLYRTLTEEFARHYV